MQMMEENELNSPNNEQWIVETLWEGWAHPYCEYTEYKVRS